MKDKSEKRKIVDAHPQVSLLSDITIKGEEHSIPIGGFSVGGFYLREGFDLVKEKTESITGEKLTYFNFVKIPKKKGVVEKIILKQKRKEERWKKNREKELQKELSDLRKKK